LFWVRPGERLPFDDGFFDTVFVESVLAMQPGETLAFAVAEISRLLKPGGKFVANETIWLDSATPAEIEQFNRACVEKFGVIQANGRYPYRSHWIDLLEKHQIRTDSWHSLDELDQEQGIAPHGWAPRLSALFTFWGRLKAKLLPRYRNIQLRYDREEAVFYGGKKYMAGILMSGVKV
jgi:SAM-dependent methyltransferase